MTIVARVAHKLIFNQAQLIDEFAAETLVSGLAQRFDVDPPADFDASRFVGRRAETRLSNGDLEEAYRIEDGIALVNVFGELVTRGAWLNAWSGLTSYEGFEAIMRAAAVDSRVRGIILDMNTPGGQGAGAMEAGKLVRAIADRKPVVAFVNAQAASAGYAIASGATRIISIPSGSVGSIGVVWMHVDRSAEHEKAGRKVTVLTEGAYKADGHPFAALDDGARGRIQSQMRELYDDFVRTVADHRDLPERAVRDTQARVYRGDRAVENGLADAVGTLDDAFAFFSQGRESGRFSLIGGTMSDSSKGPAGPAAGETVAKADHEAALAAARTEAHAAGVQAERARIGAILGHENAKGRESLAQHFAFKTAMPADSAIEALAAAAPAAAAAAKTHRLDNLAPNPKVDADLEPISPAQAAAEGWESVVKQLNAEQSRGASRGRH
ncbi:MULTISPECIES: S49 family peptidase [Methylosinus]|uniref:Peptidase S49 n=1 Tax=Methylosinus trichosporium (strain ATCC 35070 / NCIMB 11131 / UNIQEM 75 / OB3b) TaxID=595536 RepID=A0A2D2CYJ2_METT3|nr:MULTISPECIES: S49 family peptidase [Methylosinus]ATQ67811.1 peptidase S49 [Methylosinus trichosporium OB3b]OBS51832.1 hypothetical protein A8B73_14345 [Methylosinus sp. 3S-1]